MADLRQHGPDSVPLDASRGDARSAAMALASAAAEGDEWATKRLLDLLAPRIARVVRVTLGVRYADLDDVTQLALIAFTMAIPSFRGECEPLHYASRIAVRTALHARRRSAIALSRYDDLAQLEDFTTPPADEDALSNRRRTLLRNLLGEIPAEQAEALALRVVLGWSLEEIAASSNTPLNTVRSRLRLAKEALRRRIEADPVLSEEFGGQR